jgi:signal transduction histidine kinase
MKQLIRDFESALQDNSPAITVSPLPILEANAPQLKNAFKNIIDNSIKFQDKTQALRVAIRSEIVTIDEKIAFNLPVDKIYFKIEFSDNGIGFNPENIDKILKPFQRLHGKSDYPGNGLGLTICKKIIENHRGIIYAMGNEISGTRFILILPEIHD